MACAILSEYTCLVRRIIELRRQREERAARLDIRVAELLTEAAEHAPTQEEEYGETNAGAPVERSPDAAPDAQPDSMQPQDLRMEESCRAAAQPAALSFAPLAEKTTQLRLESSRLRECLSKRGESAAFRSYVELVKEPELPGQAGVESQ